MRYPSCRSAQVASRSLASVCTFSSAMSAAHFATLSSILDDSILLRVESFHLLKISRSCASAHSSQSQLLDLAGRVGSRRNERGGKTHERDDMHVLRVLPQDVVHEVEPVEAHEAAEDVVIGRELHAREELFEDAPRLERLPQRGRHLGHFVQLDRMKCRLCERRTELESALPAQQRDSQASVGRTTKSSSSFLPFFFLLPLRPSASTSSAIPSASMYRSSIPPRSVCVLPPMNPTQLGSPQKHSCATWLRGVPTTRGQSTAQRESATGEGAQDAPVAVDVVVERELLVLLDGALGKDAHAHLAPDGPLCDDAVWVARVVEEPPLAALLGCVDELRHARRASALGCHEEGTGEREAERTTSRSSAIK